MTCPLCGAVVERVRGGTVHVPHAEQWTFAIVYRAHLATFDACTGCEWCRELAPETKKVINEMARELVDDPAVRAEIRQLARELFPRS